MISVRWRPSDWMQFSSLFFKIALDTGQQLTIDWTNFLTDGFLQIIQRKGVVRVNTRFQIPKRLNHMLKDREGVGATARLRNGKWGVRETCFEQWSLTRLQCALWHHFVESTHWHSLFFFGAVLALSLPTKYYPFKRCQIPVGHSVLMKQILHISCKCF